jgi:hypothetical protein
VVRSASARRYGARPVTSRYGWWLTSNDGKPSSLAVVWWLVTQA